MSSFALARQLQIQLGKFVFMIFALAFTSVVTSHSLAEDIPMMVLLKFCSEGDNAQDALRMAEYANTVLKVVDCTVSRRVHPPDSIPLKVIM